MLKGVRRCFFAVMYLHYEIARLLIKHGANPSSQNNKGKSPLSIAKSKKMKKILGLLNNPSSVSLVGWYYLPGFDLFTENHWRASCHCYTLQHAQARATW